MPENDKPQVKPPQSLAEALVRLLDPIPLTIMVILLGVTLLIGLSAFDKDAGLLARMANPSFARGLITYLFAVTTIGTTVVLVMAALTKGTDEETFERGKEALGLLLGVFGTIVGFYFGSSTGATATLSVSEPHLSAASVSSGGSVTVSAVLSGGNPPYRYSVGSGEASSLVPDQPVGSDRWIVANFKAPVVDKETVIPIHLVVADSSDHTTATRASLTVTPAPGGGPASPSPPQASSPPTTKTEHP